MITNWLAVVSLAFFYFTVADGQNDVTVPAVRVVRLQVDYKNASITDLQKIHKFVVPTNDLIVDIFQMECYHEKQRVGVVEVHQQALAHLRRISI